MRSYADIVSRLYVQEDARFFPGTEQAVRRLPQIPVHYVRCKEEIAKEHRNAGTLFITVAKGRLIGRCPGSKGHICCNYLTADLYMGCTLGCSYCIMRSYLNFEPVTVHVNTGALIEELRNLAAANEGRVLRAGTGEVGDSLLYDPLFGLSREIIEGIADLHNLWFELKTKTDHVDHLLDIQNKGHTVIGFSLNPQTVIDAEEGVAASLNRRLEAALKAMKAGYRISFHFDPIFLAFRNEYCGLIRRLGMFPAERIAWISLGTFRYPPHLKDRMEKRPYLYDEFVPCVDGKYRYIQRIRVRLYRSMMDSIRSLGNIPVYLCMESSSVWRSVAGDLPGNIPALNDIFESAQGLP